MGTKPPDDGSSLHHAAAGGGPQRRYQPPPRQTLSQPLAARGDPKRRRAGGISAASAATAEDILRATPEVESYSRRTGARLALSIAEPNTGDFIWSPQPIEVKLFSTDIDFLKRKAPEVAERLGKVRGVVDILDGLIYAGPSLVLRVRHAEAARLGFSAADVAEAVGTAMLGQTASSVLEGDRVINIRVRAEHSSIERAANLHDLPLRAPDGTVVKLSQVADIVETPGQLELRREDLRQDVAVTARLEGRDLGSAMAEIRELLGKDPSLPPGTVEFGGLYQQQQESFGNLMLVLGMAIFLVFTVLLIEFRSFYEPLAIVFGAVLALFGTVLALWLTGTSLNVVSLLGAIIGVGIVAKNGILMLDRVEHLRAEGLGLEDALVRSGHRRLRPVLMTSMAAAFGMLPLAWGIGSGADMLRPLAIAVIGALCISVLLSLVATPTVYSLLLQLREGVSHPPAGA